MTKEDLLISHVENSIKLATLDTNSHYPFEAVKGFSTATMRRMFRNICGVKGLRYLEIGAYFGGTACGAINKPGNECFIVEDFSQPFGEAGVELGLKENLKVCASYTDGKANYTLLEQDAFDVVKPLPKNIDVYFYDGEHSYENQKRAMTHFFENMNDLYIQIVDDYAWESVHTGTQDGLKSLPITKLYEFSVQPPANDDPIWHNGIYVAVLRKK